MMRQLIVLTFCILLIFFATAVDIPSKIEQDFNSIAADTETHEHQHGGDGIMGKAGRVVREAVEGVADTLSAGDLAAKEALIKNTPAKTKSEM
uniref:Uncharacterized protein n=1 Tax=Panagrolaimus sp. PS1159 TaxID=55785 RepID=A0AC35GB02_9BILA